MDRLITIEAATSTLDPAGAPVETWSTFATLRAALARNVVADEERAQGSVTDARLTFTTWWVDGITLDHRVTYAGQAYEIRDLAEVGRRNGLTITVRRFGP